MVAALSSTLVAARVASVSSSPKGIVSTSGTRMAGKYKFRPASRLRRNADFLEIRGVGKPYRCPYFALFTRIRVSKDDADFSCPRLGISASRRVGNSPQRNLAKRRLRELFRLNQHAIKPGVDIVVSLRSPATKASFQELEQRFLHALQFKKVLRKKDQPSADPGPLEPPDSQPASD